MMTLKPVIADIRSAFSPRKRVSIAFSGVGRTKQSMKDECDVNLIVKRFIATGELPSGNLKSPIFGDVTGVDFRGMMDVIAAADAAFERLPALVRKRFGNDASAFVEFCSDSENAEDLIRMGLATAQTVVQPGEGSGVVVAPVAAVAAVVAKPEGVPAAKP